MKIAFLAMCLVAAVLGSGAHVATASTQQVAPYDTTLGVEARYALQSAKFQGNNYSVKQIYVRCYRDDQTFNAAAMWRFGEDLTYVWAYTLAKSHTVYMRGRECNSAHSFMRKLKSGRLDMIEPYEVGAYSTLLHEALHVQGYKDEKMTECAANDSVRWAVMGNYGFSKGEANFLSRMAFAWSYKAVARSYYTNPSQCQRSLNGADWTDGLV
jgi:hypothetical protein